MNKHDEQDRDTERTIGLVLMTIILALTGVLVAIKLGAGI